MCAHGSLVVTKVGKSMVRRRPWGEDREDKNKKVMKADRTICRAAMGPARVHKGTEPSDGLMGTHGDQGDCRVWPRSSAYMLWLSGLWFPTVGVGAVSDPLPTCGVLFFLLGCLIHP